MRLYKYEDMWIDFLVVVATFSFSNLLINAFEAVYGRCQLFLPRSCSSYVCTFCTKECFCISILFLLEEGVEKIELRTILSCIHFMDLL